MQIELKPDLFVIGNVVSRGNPLMEEILSRGLAFISGPQWLYENVLRGKWVLAVAGTHGKTTVTSMLAWILEHAGLNPGFLIGGVPINFDISARVTDSAFFVIEADEYDTAFFDKRSKFVHYMPRTAILNNLEFDHADIFADLAAIETQFHHLVRTIPGNGLIIANGREQSMKRVLARGVWSKVELLGVDEGWIARARDEHAFDVFFEGGPRGTVNWESARRAQSPQRAGGAGRCPPRRRAGHQGHRRAGGVQERETPPGSAWHRQRHHRIRRLRPPSHCDRNHNRGSAQQGQRCAHPCRAGTALEHHEDGRHEGRAGGKPAGADLVFCYTNGLGWDAGPELASLGAKSACFDDLGKLTEAIAAASRPGDHVLVMSNGGFGGIHTRLLEALRR